MKLHQLIMAKLLSIVGLFLLFLIVSLTVYAGGNPCADWQINPHNKCEVYYRNEAWQDVRKNAFILVTISLIAGVFLSKKGTSRKKVFVITLLIFLIGSVLYLITIPSSIRIYLFY